MPKEQRVWFIVGVFVLAGVLAYVFLNQFGSNATPAAASEAPAAVGAAGPAAGNAPQIFTEDDRPRRLAGATQSWNTNWNRHTIQYDELLSGGPPRDGIPSIDNPVFLPFADVGAWLAANEPVIALEVNGAARAYPLQLLP